MTAPDRLKDLEKRLGEFRNSQAKGAPRPQPTHLGIAGRFTTELVAALIVGGALGWGVDWLMGYFGLHTKPLFLVLFFVLGAVAGIRNVMRAATEINAAMAAKNTDGD